MFLQSTVNAICTTNSYCFNVLSPSFLIVQDRKSLPCPCHFAISFTICNLIPLKDALRLFSLSSTATALALFAVNAICCIPLRFLASRGSHFIVDLRSAACGPRASSWPGLFWAAPAALLSTQHSHTYENARRSHSEWKKRCRAHFSISSGKLRFCTRDWWDVQTCAALAAASAFLWRIQSLALAYRNADGSSGTKSPEVTSLQKNHSLGIKFFYTVNTQKCSTKLELMLQISRFAYYIFMPQ